MIITNSAMTAFQWCHKRYYWRYVRGLDSRGVNFHLKCGEFFHIGLADLMRGKSLEDALCGLVAADPKHLDALLYAKFLLERYVIRWEGRVMRWHELVSVEQPMCAPFSSMAARPIGDPQESHSEQVWLAGVIDALVRDSQKRLWVVEHKTASEIDMDYLAKVALDGQITTYIDLVNRALGEMPHGVVYNVVSKPRIYKRQGEDTEAYLRRAAGDYLAHPNGFFGEQVAYRNPDALVEFEAEVRQALDEIQACADNNLWARNTQVCFIRGRVCPYVGLCRDGETIALGDYEARQPHEELVRAGLQVAYEEGSYGADVLLGGKKSEERPAKQW